MITEQEWQEYLKIKKQLDLVKKVEQEISIISCKMEQDEGFDPEFEDVDRCITLEENEIISKVWADGQTHEFKILKEKIVAKTK